VKRKDRIMKIGGAALWRDALFPLISNGGDRNIEEE
jgi:hypothetical protein